MHARDGTKPRFSRLGQERHSGPGSLSSLDSLSVEDSAPGDGDSSSSGPSKPAPPRQTAGHAMHTSGHAMHTAGHAKHSNNTAVWPARHLVTEEEVIATREEAALALFVRPGRAEGLGHQARPAGKCLEVIFLPGEYVRGGCIPARLVLSM